MESTPEKSAQKQQKIRLLEVKNIQTPPKQTDLKTQEQIEKEKMQQMILEKLVMLEEGSEHPDVINSKAVATSHTPLENQLQAKLTKVYNDKDLDNKQKIEAIYDLYLSELIPMYKKQQEDLISVSSRLSLENVMEDHYDQQTKKAENIVQKYTLLSGEYQSQAKQFKQKHEEIKESEVKKRMDIQSNFEKHFEGIKE